MKDPLNMSLEGFFKGIEFFCYDVFRNKIGNSFQIIIVVLVDFYNCSVDILIISADLVFIKYFSERRVRGRSNWNLLIKILKNLP